MWVKLPLELQVRKENEKMSANNYCRIFAQINRTSCRTALVKGQAGSGKTTLVKKIAFDWASSREDDKVGGFDIVLAAPLRSIKSGFDPLEMALNFHLSRNGRTASSTEVERYSKALRESRWNILVILDGLDEYNGDSVLSQMFCSAVGRHTPKMNADAIQFEYDFLITSRPYACKKINDSLEINKWKILGIKEWMTFVKRNCRSEQGKARATKFLQKSTILNEINKIPLLLLFIRSRCHYSR